MSPHSSPKLLVATALLAVAACRTTAPPPVAGATAVAVTFPLARNVDGCVDRFDPSADYFPEKARFRHSTQLRVDYHGHYKILTFTPAVGTGEILQYALVQCGTPAPPRFPRARVVTVPMRRFTTSNHSILSTITRLELQDRLVGVANRLSITEPTIRTLALDRRIAEVGSGTHSNIELAMAVSPDVHFTFYSAYPQSNLHPRLWEMGVKALPLADHMEPTPLGRAEWLVYLGILTNRERSASRVFDSIESRYEALRARARGVTARPVVMTGRSDTRDSWDLRGGDNHFAVLIHDAGGEYFWRDGGSSSYVRPHYETVLHASNDALFWIGGPDRVPSHTALVADDPRFAHMRPVRERRVHALDRNGLGTWTYPWVDQSLDRPDAILADLIGVLHPELGVEAAPAYIRALE